MSHHDAAEITRILHDWNNGDRAAGARLMPLVYQELKRQAGFLMSLERGDHTLQPTALVHEAFLKISDLNEIKWNDRRHFYRFATHVMRQILVDHARRHAAEKRGKKVIHFSIEDLQIPAAERAEAVVRLDDALEELASFDRRQAQIVEMRYFGGLTETEIAETLEISERTVRREWREAKTWLYHHINRK